MQEPLNGNISLTPTLTLTAGTRDKNGTIVDPGNINAGDSGVIGINAILKAAGKISGLVIARGNATVNAVGDVSGTFLAGGTANLSAVGTISAIAIGGTAVTIGSGTFTGVALSQNGLGRQRGANRARHLRHGEHHQPDRRRPVVGFPKDRHVRRGGHG